MKKSRISKYNYTCEKRLKRRFERYVGRLSKFLPEHNKNLGRSYMVATPQKVKYDILNVLLPFQLMYNVRSMAVLANPLAWVARAIGSATFSPLRTPLCRAKIVLLSLLVLQTHTPF